MPCLIFTCVVLCILARRNGLNDFLWQSIEHYLSFVCWILSILKMLYGYEQRLWVIEVMDTEEPPISDVQSWLQERRAMTDNLKLHLNRANQQMKTQADKGFLIAPSMSTICFS